MKIKLKDGSKLEVDFWSFNWAVARIYLFWLGIQLLALFVIALSSA